MAMRRSRFVKQRNFLTHSVFWEVQTSGLAHVLSTDLGTWPAPGVLRARRPQCRLSTVHEVLPVAEATQRETFLQHLGQHERRETTYLKMSRGLAQSGIEKWKVDTVRMTIAFFNKAGREMLVEQIK
jgi:hypothetical protein